LRGPSRQSYLLRNATLLFGDRRIGELSSQEIAEWRMTRSRSTSKR
jgi:hypothetical protein